MHRRRKSFRPECKQTYAPPDTPPNPSLPHGWAARFDARYQRFYYIDLATKRSQWEVPVVAVNAPIQGRASGEYHRPASFPDFIESPEPREQDTGRRGAQGLLICGAVGEGGSGGQGSSEDRGGAGACGCAHAGCASCGRGAFDRREASGSGGRDGNGIESRTIPHESDSYSAPRRGEAHRPRDRPGCNGENNSRSIHPHGSAEAGGPPERAGARETSQPIEVVDRGRSRPANLGTILGSGLSLVTDTGAGLMQAGTGLIHGGADIVREATDLAVHTGADIVHSGVDLLHNAADVVAGGDGRGHSCADCPYCGAVTARIAGGSGLMCGAGAGIDQIVGAAGVIALARSGDLVCGVDFPYSGTGVVTVPDGTELVYRMAGVNRVTTAETPQGQGKSDGACGGELTHTDCPPPREGRSLVNLFRRAFRGFWMLVRLVTRR